MGGVPVLMALAAMGIGYGWHPDGNGGVEYVIQISPEKLDHVEQVGEITSTVPPEVQGNVSRVVVRVGRQPLERRTPSSWDHARAAANSSPPAVGRRPGTREDAAGELGLSRLSIAQSDHSPVPIPEIGESPAAEASVMKPAPQNSAESGFQFPGAVREAAVDALNQTRQGIDEAARRGQASVQRGIHSTIDEAGEALRRTADAAFAPVEPGAASRFTPTAAHGERPAYGSASSAAPADRRQQVPTFTGDDPSGRVAQARTGGPSTEPTDTQDDSWYELDEADRHPQSSDPPSLQRGTSAQPSASSAPRSSAGTGNRGSQGNAERPTAPRDRRQSRDPDTAPSDRTGEQTTPGSANAHSSSTRGADSDTATPGTDRGPGNENRSDDSSHFGMPGNFGRMPQGLQEPASQQNGESNGQRRVTSNRGGEEQSQDGRFAPGDRPSNSGGSDRRYTAPGEASGNAGGGYASGPDDAPSGTGGRSSVDPRLRAGEASALPPGGWSYDANGRPVDREGYVLDQHGRRMTASGESPGGYRDRGAANQPRGYAEPNDEPASPNYPGRFASGEAAAPNSRQYDEPRWPGEANRQRPGEANRQRPSEADRRYASAPPERGRSDAGRPAEPPPAASPASGESSGEATSARGGSRSQSDQLASEADSRGRPGDRRSVAAQPLFNGLLLISFVANVYLAFWLKNLRHQFRELVAAKRVSTSSDSPSRG